ncbi:MAG TPA: CAP domain-containing protein [Roseiarcus sp.]|nr:CAP domain-containing protein [Roseiarcus sp.]
MANDSGVRTLVLAGLAALALAGCAGEPEPRLTHRLSPQAIGAVRLDPNAAVSALNAYRGSRGLKAVRLDPALTAMAERQAKAMAAGDVLSHDVAGAFPARLAESGIDTWKAGENLGGGYMSLAEAMTGWRESHAHDANLLIPEGTRFGIAIAKNPDTQYGVYWAMEIAAEPAPATRQTEAPFLSQSGGALRPQ